MLRYLHSKTSKAGDIKVGQKPKTFVEINGKKYDAITGQLVESTAAPAPKSPPAPPEAAAAPKQPQSGGYLGGMVSAGSNQPDSVKPQAAHSKDVHKRTSKAHSLHRDAAKSSKPVPPSPQDMHDDGHDEQPQPARRQLAQNVDPSRLHRSSKHAKSTSIAKFSAGRPAESEAAEKSEPLAVPAGEPNSSPAISPKDDLIAKRLAETAANQPVEPEEPPLKQRLGDRLKNGRGGSVMAASLAALLLIGYVTYLNIPRMALRVAAGRAGFSAEMPGYAPSGFRFNGPVAYSPGELTLQYTSNTDDRYYQIKERETDWDSYTLLDKYVAPETELYSTYQERGLTIYVFDGSTATWVNGGIWYTISGDSELTSEQLLRIAASL